MKELFSMGLFWFFVLAEFFIFFIQRAVRDWRGANQVIPEIMKLIFVLCQTAMIVLIIFVFIKVHPWWYGLVMIGVGYVLPMLVPPGRTLDLILGMVGMIAGPLSVVLSFLKVFAVI